MYYLYIAIITLLLPVEFCRHLIASLVDPTARDRLRGRFGQGPKPHTDRQLVWIHAVSVGEVQASRPLVYHMLNNHPGCQVMITTVTATAAGLVNHSFSGRVIHRYLPVDSPVFIRRFLMETHPCLLIVMETEIWPVLFNKCRMNRVPVIIANARLSDQSFRRYRWLSGLTRSTLDQVDAIAAQSRSDADRFKSLVSDPDKVSVMGNLKFDAVEHDRHTAPGLDLRTLAEDRTIIIAASTHEGEEQIVLKAFETVRIAHEGSFLVLVPRHPQRSAALLAVVQSLGFTGSLYSSQAAHPAACDILIVDVIGALQQLYPLVDIVFIGGSLVPSGGHNMLEPASLSLPVITGRHVFNFREVYSLLSDSGAILTAGDGDELARSIIDLINDGKARKELGSRARQVVNENQGSIRKLAALIDGTIKLSN